LYSKISGDQDGNKNTCRFCASIYSTAKEPDAKQMISSFQRVCCTVTIPVPDAHRKGADLNILYTIFTKK
jgi:hypothetical protein